MSMAQIYIIYPCNQEYACNQNNVKQYNKKNKQNQKINATSLTENKNSYFSFWTFN